MFCAIGALLGWKAIFYVIIYSFLTAAIICLIRLAAKSELKNSFLTLGGYMKLCFIYPKLIPAHSTDNRHLFKLSPAIAAGVLIYFVSRYMMV